MHWHLQEMVFQLLSDIAVKDGYLYSNIQTVCFQNLLPHLKMCNSTVLEKVNDLNNKMSLESTNMY